MRSSIAAATRRSTTARRWSWRASPRTRPILRAAPSTATPNGELNGRVTDSANIVFSGVGRRPKFTAEQAEQRERDGIAHISKQFVRYGLTSVHHRGRQSVRAAAGARARRAPASGQLRIERPGARVDDRRRHHDWIRRRVAAVGRDLRAHGRRLVLRAHDGAQPAYPGSQPPYKGNVTESQDDLNAWIERVHRAGIQVNCHANGDVAIGMLLTAVERAQKLFPRADARPKITHCTLVNDDLVRRMKAVGAVPAMFTTYAYYNADKFPFYGEALMSRCMAFRTLLDAGIHGGSGLGLQPRTVRAVDGHSGNGDAHRMERQTWGANQRITRREALRDQHAQRRLRVTRGSDQGLDHPREARRLRDPRRRSAHGRPRTESRTSRSCARLQVAPPFTRPRPVTHLSGQPRGRRCEPVSSVLSATNTGEPLGLAFLIAVLQ